VRLFKDAFRLLLSGSIKAITSGLIKPIIDIRNYEFLAKAKSGTKIKIKKK